MPALPVADNPLEVRRRGELARLYFTIHLAPVGRLFVGNAPVYGTRGYMLPDINGEVEVYKGISMSDAMTEHWYAHR